MELILIDEVDESGNEICTECGQAVVSEPNINKIRHIVKDLYAEFWTDADLWDFWEANDQDGNGVISACMEDLAANPDKARKWGSSEVRLTHYDLMQMAKPYREKQADAAITQTQIARVAGNWIDQPGVRFRDKSLIKLGEGLMLAEPERARALKAALPDEWQQWDGEFDEYGRPLPGDGE